MALVNLCCVVYLLMQWNEHKHEVKAWFGRIRSGLGGCRP